ncbi:MAG: type II toxin-antitoxin system VapC family toxin [Treponema sp.]|jgi:predicted nucleic acid-binding protein|nr:type II toxin-antitoxin system VapC family toxin [Treponema sp.]
MTYVLTCSFCAALFLPNVESEKVHKGFCKIQEGDEVVIPLLWWQEMSALLSASVNKGQLKALDVQEITGLLSAYHFVTDVSYGSNYMEKILGISRLYGISPADATYLELALRKKGAMGALNRELKEVCTRIGITLL